MYGSGFVPSGYVQPGTSFMHPQMMAGCSAPVAHGFGQQMMHGLQQPMPMPMPALHDVQPGRAADDGDRASRQRGSSRREPPRTRRGPLTRHASGGSGPRSRSRSPNDRRALPRFKDDHQGVSSSFRSLGLAHMVGLKRCMPKSFRASMIAACDPVLFPMYKLAALESQDVDFMNWIVTGCSPATRPVDFQVQTKRDLRQAARDAYDLKQSTQPGRLRMLGEEWDNLASCAMRLGYREEWLEPVTYSQWQVHQSRASSGLHDHAVPMARTAARLPSPPASQRRGPAAMRALSFEDSQSQEPATEHRPRMPPSVSSGSPPPRRQLHLEGRRPLERPARSQPPVAPPRSQFAALEDGPVRSRSQEHRRRESPPRASEPPPAPVSQQRPAALPRQPVSWTLPEMSLPAPRRQRPAAEGPDLFGLEDEVDDQRPSYMDRIRAMRRPEAPRASADS